MGSPAPDSIRYICSNKNCSNKRIRCYRFDRMRDLVCESCNQVLSVVKNKYKERRREKALADLSSFGINS